MELQKRLQSVEKLLGTVDATADPHLRATVHELVQLIMDLHGECLERMLELIRASEDANVIHKMGADDLVGSLFILYGLHPLDLETRVRGALDKIASRLRARGGSVEVLDIHDGTVRLRVGAGDALKQMVEDAIYRAAPDVTALIIEGAEAKAGFVPIEMLLGVTAAEKVAL